MDVESDDSISSNKYFKSNVNRKRFNSGQRHIILNVYSRLRQANFGTVQKCVAETARLTGASMKTVYVLKREWNAAEDSTNSKPRLKTPGKRHVNRATRLQYVDHFDRDAIRKLIHTQFLKNNQTPTLCKVKAAIDAEKTLPKIGRSSLHCLLKEMGIVFKKRKRNAMRFEDDATVLWRQKYLRQIRAHREAGRKLYWLDETWINANHTASTDGDDGDGNEDQAIPVADQTTASTALALAACKESNAVKDNRLIAVHAGSDTGFVAGALFVFEGNRQGGGGGGSSGNYQQGMTGEVFENWFTKTLLPRLEPNSVVILDNAPYHSVKMEKIPAKGWKKAKIQAWLACKGIPFTDDMITVELLQLVNEVRDKYDVYRVDLAAKVAGHTVLRLPPHHCMLNPIEMVWEQVKHFIAYENKSLTLAEVMRLLHDGVERVTAYDWACYVQYVQKEEHAMWSAPEVETESEASDLDGAYSTDESD